jgi:hypothetical protein
VVSVGLGDAAHAHSFGEVLADQAVEVRVSSRGSRTTLAKCSMSAAEPGMPRGNGPRPGRVGGAEDPAGQGPRRPERGGAAGDAAAGTCKFPPHQEMVLPHPGAERNTRSLFAEHGM